MLYDWSMESNYSTLLKGSLTDVAFAWVGGANTTPLLSSATYFAKQKIIIGFLLLQSMNSSDEKEKVWNPARIHSPDPFLRAEKFSRGFAKSFSPENSFGKTESVLKPHALPEYLEGRTT